MYKGFRKSFPNFVSKMELGKGIPSVSYNLRHGDNVLIDRSDPRQAINTLMKFGQKVEENKLTAVIFPEGTRSKTGVPKPFRESGLKMMVKKAPSAYIIPLSINNSWRLVRKGSFPLGVGIKVTMEAHKPIKADSMPFDELFSKIEKTINEALVKLNPVQQTV
jgi:1-acyl-sn-glycerol-3-phosphate acyltransferase